MWHVVKWRVCCLLCRLQSAQQTARTPFTYLGVSEFSPVFSMSWPILIESSWKVMAHGNAREGKWRRNWRMQWVASTLRTTSEHGVSSITTADAHTSAASSRLNWRLCRFKWTRPFRRKTKSGFCACAITFQTQSTIHYISNKGFKPLRSFVNNNEKTTSLL